MKKSPASEQAVNVFTSSQPLTWAAIQNALLRLNEAQLVMEMFAGRLHARVVHVDAAAPFMAALAGVADPEAKRRIIGREFVEVFQREAGKLKNARWLAQGTIYPDVIESGGASTKKAKTIKSHHNVGGLPETLGLKLLEPLRPAHRFVADEQPALAGSGRDGELRNGQRTVQPPAEISAAGGRDVPLRERCERDRSLLEERRLAGRGPLHRRAAGAPVCTDAETARRRTLRGAPARGT